DHAAGLDPAGRFELVHGHDGPGTDLDNVAADVEVVENRLEQARITLEPGAVDLLARLLGRRGQELDRRQLVAVTECEAGLCAQRPPLLGSPGGRRALVR